MNNEEVIQKAAEAMVPILEQESNMIWGERSCANILRWTLAKAGLCLTPLAADKSLIAAEWESVDRAPEILEDGERVMVWLVSNDSSNFEYWTYDDWYAENQRFFFDG